MHKLLKIKCFVVVALLFSQGMIYTASCENSEKLTDLKKQRTELQMKMHEKRLELIGSVDELKKLHDKVLALHREMALLLDKNKEMKPLVEKAKDLDAEIKKLEELENKLLKLDEDVKDSKKTDEGK